MLSRTDMNGWDKRIKLNRYFIKNYKKNSLAIFLSFFLTFLLLTVILILIQTNHRIANLQLKTEFTDADCSIEDLSKEQIEQIKGMKFLDKIAIQQQEKDVFERNGQTLFLTKGNHILISMTSKIKEGRMPKEPGEVVAERWSLLNMGIEPKLNESFQIYNKEGQETKEVKLVGILSDMYANKKYGMLSLYTSLDQQTKDLYLAYLRFDKQGDNEEKVQSLKKELNIEEKQVKENPAREDLRELYITEAEVSGIILLICMVVFYGIYRITILSRQKQYGILRAIGMKKGQLLNVILLELYQLFVASVPVGIAAGIALAAFIMTISGDKETEIYLYNETVRFDLVMPVWQIVGGIVIAAFIVGMIGYTCGKKVIGSSPVNMISGNPADKSAIKSVWRIGRLKSKTGTILQMACKYILKDVKTSMFAILTICLGIVLFTSLSYRASQQRIYREDTKEMYYLNGQYAMTMLSFNHTNQGISRSSVEEMKELTESNVVKTSSGIPIRIVDEENIKRNQDYYDNMNQKMRNLYGYGNAGYDGTNQVYKSILYGYNKNALTSLSQYIISGHFEPEYIGEDEVILCVLRTDDMKNNQSPGSFKEGTPLMHYKVGDRIPIKYRADLKTDSSEYESFQDIQAEYIYRTYKIAAIVSFPYMYDCNRTVYPLLITSDQQVRKIAPESGYQSIYYDSGKELSSSQQDELEQSLIRISSKDSNVSTRSLISEIKQNEMFYHKQMVYIYGIAAVAFVLFLINIMNNLRYRMQVRTTEICMLRAIGMSVLMTKKILLFENLVLAAISVIVAFFLSQPVLRYLYQISNMQAFGHPFRFDYRSFVFAAGAACVICISLSFNILKSWKTRQITQTIGAIE